MDQTKIDDFNMALLSMCEQMGLKFLNSAEALKDANGYGREDYYQTGDIHLKPVGLKAMLSYLRTHATRPTTAARHRQHPHPRRVYPEPQLCGDSTQQLGGCRLFRRAGVLYQASYRVDKTGGTLSSGSDSGKTSLSYEVTSAAQSISVTAVPQDGYVFVNWSDGVTQKTRTDTNFKQNVDVTAVFAAASVHISSTGKAVWAILHLYRKAGRQAPHCRQHPLVRQRCGSAAGGGQDHRQGGDRPLHAQCDL